MLKNRCLLNIYNQTLYIICTIVMSLYTFAKYSFISCNKNSTLHGIE